MNSTDYLNEIVKNWSKEQRIKYLTDLNEESLVSVCVDRLELDFSDCKTKEQVVEIANNKYLNNPLGEQ